MGGGRHEDQVGQRFDQGTPEWTGEKEVCGYGWEPFMIYGPYELWQKEEGVELRKEGESLGTYPGVASIEDDRVLLKLDNGMLLEVTESDTRDLFCKEKAMLLALIESDGNIQRDPEGNPYVLRFGSKSDELLDLFSGCLSATYSMTPSRYQHKDRKHFFEMGKVSREAAADVMKYINKHGSKYWEVPAEYMDKEAARAYLRAFMSGDGSIGYYPKTKRLKVRFFSNNREGLRGLADLMEEHFGIASVIYPLEGELPPDKEEYTLSLNRNEDMIHFIEEIGSFKESHQKAIEGFWEHKMRRDEGR
jgi:DNA-binding transcriptional regulator WhiA